MAEKFTDYLLGFTQTDNFINIGAFAKQSSLFQTIAMDGGALSNITWIFAFIGFVYIALNPSSWKATVIGPWLFLLLLFQSGRFSDPLFFKRFDFTQDFQNSYLDCTAIQNDSVPLTAVDKVSGKVKIRCIAKETPGASAGAAGSNNQNLPSGVILDEEFFFDEDGPNSVMTLKEVLKLKGIDITSSEFSAVYAYTPQLVLIDTLTRLHTIMADALLHKMDQTASGIIAASRVARTSSLIDKRPIYEANVFEQACGDVEGIQNVTFLSPDQADTRFPDVVSSLKQRELTLYDLLVAFNFFYNSVEIDSNARSYIDQYTIRPPVATNLIIANDAYSAWGRKIHGRSTFEDTIKSKLKSLTSVEYLSGLNTSGELLAVLEQDLNSPDDQMDQNKLPFLPLNLLFLDPDQHAPGWFSSIFFNKPSDTQPEVYINMVRNKGKELYSYIFGEHVPVDQREALLDILKAVRVNSGYFGTPKYAPLATTDITTLKDQQAAQAAKNDYGKEIQVGSANVNAQQGSATGVAGDIHLSNAYKVAGNGKALNCYDYYTYIAELTDESIMYQIDMYRDLPEVFGQVEAGKFANVTQLLKRNYPECVSQTNSGRGAVTVSNQCNANKVRDFVMNSGAATMARLETAKMHEEATRPEFSDTLAGNTKAKISSLGEWLFDDYSGDFIVSVVSAFSGFMTGSFAALMPKIIAWMTALVIVVTPFLYMMGLIVPVWGVSIILMPLIGVLYLQSVQIVYVVIKAAFGNLNQFVTSGGEQTSHLAMFDMVLGMMYISVFIFTAFLLFNLNDAGAMVRQMSGKLDSSATIDAKEVIGGAMAVAGIAALPGKAAGVALGAVKTAGNIAHSGNILTNAAGTVAGAWNDGVESGINRKHKNISNLGGSGAESMNFGQTVQNAAADATAKNAKTVATEEAFKQAGGGKAKTSAKVTRDGQEYDLGTGAGVLAGAVHEIHTDAKIAQEVTVNLINEMANNDGFKAKPVLNAQTGQYEQQISPEMLSTVFQKKGDELSKAVAASKKFRTNDKGEAFMVFGEVPKRGSSRPAPEPKEEQPKGKPTR